MTIPFLLYDFFGYLASGFLTVVTVDRLFGIGAVIGRDLKGADVILVAIVVYIIGHLLSELAQIIVGHKTIGRKFGTPMRVLMKRVPREKWHWIFAAYYSPLPQSVVDQIAQKACAANIDIDKEEFFYQALGSAKCSDVMMGRLDIFLTLYGFSRNVFFVGCILSCLCIIHGLLVNKWDEVLIGIVVGIAALGMFNRYLRFYRQYALELLLGYWKI